VHVDRLVEAADAIELDRRTGARREARGERGGKG
jgi:hypothetical protein